MKDLKPEQIKLLSRKLDEIKAASTRMGRKDWVNYVAGTITAVCITAAFAPDQTQRIFSSINTALSWFFASGVLLFLR